MVRTPSLIARKPGQRAKTHLPDAVKPVRLLRAADLFAFHVPTIEDEAFRDPARASARDDLKQAQQRPKSFLLLHGWRYAGRTDCGPPSLCPKVCDRVDFDQDLT